MANDSQNGQEQSGVSVGRAYFFTFFSERAGAHDSKAYARQMFGANIPRSDCVGPMLSSI